MPWFHGTHFTAPLRWTVVKNWTRRHGVVRGKGDLETNGKIPTGFIFSPNQGGYGTACGRSQDRDEPPVPHRFSVVPGSRTWAPEENVRSRMSLDPGPKVRRPTAYGPPQREVPTPMWVKGRHPWTGPQGADSGGSHVWGEGCRWPGAPMLIPDRIRRETNPAGQALIAEEVRRTARSGCLRWHSRRQVLLPVVRQSSHARRGDRLIARRRQRRHGPTLLPHNCQGATGTTHGNSVARSAAWAPAVSRCFTVRTTRCRGVEPAKRFMVGPGPDHRTSPSGATRTPDVAEGGADPVNVPRGHGQPEDPERRLPPRQGPVMIQKRCSQSRVAARP